MNAARDEVNLGEFVQYLWGRFFAKGETMKKFDKHRTWIAARIALAGALATGGAISIAGSAVDGVAWAQGGPGSGQACSPGVRSAGGTLNGNDGIFTPGSGVEMRLCGERGRFVYTMGGAPYVREFMPTLSDFPPPIVDNPNNWHGHYMFHPLCEVIPSASDLPGAKLTVRLISYESTADVSTTITLSPDTEKPTLTTTSTPRKGSRVKPGDTIRVRMEASEEYNTYRNGWQTGVKKIQLIDESRNQVVPGHFENTGGPRPCKEKQWKQFLEVTYTVPPNPPPVIRLRAVAEDFAGNVDTDVGEFFTENVTDAKAPTRTYEYDVTFRSVLKNEGSRYVKTNIFCCGESEWAWEVTSTGRFPNVRVTVEPIAGGAKLAIRGDTPATSARVTGKWRWFKQYSKKLPVDVNCNGEMTRDVSVSMRMFAVMNANRTNNASSESAIQFSGASRIDLGANCKVRLPVYHLPHFTWNGLNVRNSVDYSNIHFDQQQDSELTSPASELLTGRAFTLDTGTHTDQFSDCPRDSGSQGVECRSRIRSEQRSVVIFTPKQ